MASADILALADLVALAGTQVLGYQVIQVQAFQAFLVIVELAVQADIQGTQALGYLDIVAILVLAASQVIQVTVELAEPVASQEYQDFRASAGIADTVVSVVPAGLVDTAVTQV